MLPLAHRVMARQILKAATFVDVTIPAWDRLLRGCRPAMHRVSAYGRCRATCRSSMIRRGSPRRTGVLLRMAARSSARSGFLAEKIAVLHADLLPRLLTAHPDRVAALIGRKGEAITAPDRVTPSGTCRPHHGDRCMLSAVEASRLLQACDVVVQPFPDGVSGRRTSVMAGLANGVAVATKSGPAHRGILGRVGGRGTRGNARGRRARRRRGTLAGRCRRGARTRRGRRRDLHDSGWRSAHRRGDSRSFGSGGIVGAPFVLVSGDFVLTGGMDRADRAWPRICSIGGHEGARFVSHRVDPAARHPRRGVFIAWRNR